MNSVEPSSRVNFFRPETTSSAIGIVSQSAVKCPSFGPRAVAGKSEHGWRAFQLLPPIIELGAEDVSLKPLPLPCGIVGVLHRQLRQGRRMSGGKSLVQFAKFLDKNSGRPRVADDVMHGQQENVILRVESQELSSHQRTGCQVERSGRLLALAMRRASSSRCACGMVLKSTIGKSDVEQRRDHLDRLAVAHARKSCAAIRVARRFR